MKKIVKILCIAVVLALAVMKNKKSIEDRG